MYHINLLKQWHIPSSQESQASLLAANHATEEHNEEGEVEEQFLPLQEQTPNIFHSQETHLTAGQKNQLEAAASEFPSIFKSTPKGHR